MNDNDLQKLLRDFSTPLYVFDADELEQRIAELNKRLSSNARLCYAIKANPFLIPLIKDSGILFEVCSPGELDICKKYKVNPEQIVFSGVCKTLLDVKTAYDFKVKTITLESPLHCKYLIQTINETKNLHEQEVILRLTCGNQFGMSREDIVSCLNELKKIDSVKIRGIHYFTGTQKKISKILDEVSFINDFCIQLSKESGVNFTDIEYGPGLSYNYFDAGVQKTDFSDFEAFSNAIKDSNFNYVVELGRYIASSCGTYVTSIMDVKHDGDKGYCIIDGGINHINYYGQIMGMKVPEVLHYSCNYEKTDSNNAEKYTICGSLCTTADVVLRELPLAKPQTGDFLIFKNIGAYSITEGIYLFLSHALPSVVIYKKGSFKKVRAALETSQINSGDF